MRVKELERTANVAWSPATQHPILLAAGTAAQQLDASFSTSASLELFALGLAEPGADMEKVAAAPSDQRFHQVVWGSGGGEKGVIVGGCDNGFIQVYSPAKMLAGQEPLVAKKDGHAGAVKTLDLNPFQANLLASGASDSEIFIWDLEQFGSPMTPGAKAQPPDTVSWLSWNKQVQHILASTFSSRCVVWDLRKNEPIIKLMDTSSHVRWRVVNWHPDVATQLCLSSEEDMNPVVQLWDLRFATSPLKVLANHTRGVTCTAWCAQDPDLLVSCGRDNRILCWNPNEATPGAELLCEIQSPHQWLFDVSWCPRNPALISCCSFDGHVSIHSLTGGQQQVLQTTSKIADSFPGMESLAPAVAPQPHVHTSVDLRKAPKWLRRPAGVSFAFGGRLVQFGSDQPGRVIVSQVVSEHEVLERAAKLDAALGSGQQATFCNEQASSASSPHLRLLWCYLSAEFSQDPRPEVLALLGYQQEQMHAKFSSMVSNRDGVNQLTNDVSKLSTGDEQGLVGTANESTDSSSIPEHAYNGYRDSPVQQGMVKEKPLPFTIPTTDDAESLIGQALLLGQTDVAVEICLQQDRMADALLLAMTGGADLLARTQYRYFKQCKGWLSNVISAVVSEDWSSVVSSCNVTSWKQVLAAILTHTSGDEFYRLCEMLGDRLEASDNPGLSQNAQICYLCSGNVDKLVKSWSGNGPPTNPLELQELVQVVALLQSAAKQQGVPAQTSMALAELLTNYAFLLASQGSFHSALLYLESAQEEAALELRGRLQQALGMAAPAAARPMASAGPRGSLATQGRRLSGHPTYPQQVFSSKVMDPRARGYPIRDVQMPDQGYDSPYKSRSRTVSQSSYDAQPYGAQPPTFGTAPAVPPPIAASPQPANFMQPAAPASAATSTKPSLLSSRKYVADPSVQGSNSYGTSSYMSPGYGSPVGGMYGSPQPAPSFGSPTPLAGPAPTMFNPSVMMEGSAPAASYNTFSQPEPTYPASAAFPKPPKPMDGQQQAPPGWNDPPSFQTQQHKTEYVPQTPITHPLFGSAPQEPVGPPSSTGQMNGGMYGAPGPMGGAVPGPMAGQYGQPQTNYPMTFSPQPQQQQQQYLQPAAPQPVAPAVIAEPPKPKAAIPEAYAHLPRIFDELRDRCSHAANHQQTKRKLDDVSKKLETMYDMLREYKLSAGTLECLQHMGQLIQAGDYQSGLGLHTQMVSGPDFSQISAFMPGLKVLLQTSLQLGVYLQ